MPICPFAFETRRHAWVACTSPASLVLLLLCIGPHCHTLTTTMTYSAAVVARLAVYVWAACVSHKSDAGGQAMMEGMSSPLHKRHAYVSPPRAPRPPYTHTTATRRALSTSSRHGATSRSSLLHQRISVSRERGGMSHASASPSVPLGTTFRPSPPPPSHLQQPDVRHHLPSCVGYREIATANYLTRLLLTAAMLFASVV